MKYYTFVLALLAFCTKLSSAPYEIIGIGAPCADLVYRVDTQFLETLPVKKGDGVQVTWDIFSAIVDRCESAGHLCSLNTGGSCSNTIKGLASLGDGTAMLGKIGSDPLGMFYCDKINRIGVIPLLIPSATPTSQIAVFVTEDCQRSFVTFPGAGHALAFEEIDPELFEGIALVHIDGYFIQDPVLAEKVLQLAKAKGAAISMDMGCPRIVHTLKETIIRFLDRYVDIAFANEDEISALFNLSPEEGCIALSEHCPIAVVLVGANGCYVSAKKEHFHSPAMDVEAVDTTGAGDLFACGFLHGFLRGHSLQDCAWLGNLLGGTVVTVLGAEIPERHWPPIHASIEEHFLINRVY